MPAGERVYTGFEILQQENFQHNEPLSLCRLRSGKRVLLCCPAWRRSRALRL